MINNTFPSPECTEQQRQKIETLAQAILDACQDEVNKDADTTLADLYDPDLIPPKLRKAQKQLYKALTFYINPKPSKAH